MEFSFDPDFIDCLTSQRPEVFKFERAIRLFQFQTWIYFSDDYEMVQAAPRMAAAALLKLYEKKAIEKESWNNRIINSKALTALLRQKDYSALYDGVFSNNGWTELLNTPTADRFNRAVSERRNTVETVCEMIDFRFRAMDHQQLTSKLCNISRSEFYRWHDHPNGKLSWRTIRTRWKANRASAPFLYVSEKLGFNFFPQVFDPKRPRSSLVDHVPDRQTVLRFFKTALYVAEKVGPDVFRDDPEILSLVKGRLRPSTSRLTTSDLSRMEHYKDRRDQMRS